jgi:hypothetical protein
MTDATKISKPPDGHPERSEGSASRLVVAQHAAQLQMTLAKKLWVAFRFVVFGVGGFVLLWISMLALTFEFSTPSEHLMSPYLALLLAFVGALMMLFGAGAWGKWGYLLVFVSTPLVMFFLFLIPPPKWLDDFFNKGTVVLLFILPFVFTYLAVSGYYRRREARNYSAPQADLPVPASEERISK